MSESRFRTASLSRAGGRGYNEDACGHGPGCWVLADGLGGHGGGEVASRIAVDRVLAALADSPTFTPQALSNAILAADRRIAERQQSEPRLERMRTTLVVLVSDGAEALWAHVGDSRLYHFRDRRILFQTADHSVPQALAKAGDIRPSQIRFHEDRNRLLRTLGNEADPRPTLCAAPVPLRAGDVFLLCSDGFWEYVTESDMELGLAKTADPQQWLDVMAARLLERAEPDHDNYSAIAVFVD